MILVGNIGGNLEKFRHKRHMSDLERHHKSRDFCQICRVGSRVVVAGKISTGPILPADLQEQKRPEKIHTACGWWREVDRCSPSQRGAVLLYVLH